MAQPGDVLGGFTLEEVVHRGGMAILWRATHPAHDLPILVKLPRLAEGEDPAAIVGFEMERMILPRLSGPHVPRCLGTGHDPLPWIAMERVDASSLLPMLDDLPRPFAEVAAIGAAVADALDALHRQGVVHLDVKPSNILHRADGAVVLVDFGLSHHRLLPDLMEEEFRLPYGTAPYMAPEQVVGVRGDPASDLFALGALMAFFTTGMRPFGDPQRLKGLMRRIWWDPKPPRMLRPDTPPWLQELILWCLEVEPQRRPASAAQLAFLLRQPEQVKLTARAERTVRDPWTSRVRRRFHPDHKPRLRRERPAEPGTDAPIVAVALELGGEAAVLHAELRRTLRHILAATPGARLACLNVLKGNLIRLDSTLDEEGRNRHLQRLLELRHWAEPMALPEERVSFHVLEANSVAGALLDYAETNNVDHLVLGASADGLGRRVLGSTSAEIARSAPCSVTVVRPRG